MNQTFEITGFEFIKEQLAQYANTDEAKSRVLDGELQSGVTAN